MNEKRAFLMLVSFGLLAIITNSAALFTTLNHPDPIAAVTANPSSQLAQVTSTPVNLAKNTSGYWFWHLVWY